MHNITSRSPSLFIDRHFHAGIICYIQCTLHYTSKRHLTLSLRKELSDSRTRDFTESYNMYYPMIFSAIHSKISDFHAAEDICQEVFIRYYSKFDGVENPRKWLFGTLRNVVFEHYRSKGRSDLDIDEIFEDASVSFVNGFRDTRVIIEGALNSIYESGSTDEKDRVLFDLVSMYNYTYMQASKELGMGYLQARYRFKKICGLIVEYLNSKGIAGLEELL